MSIHHHPPYQRGGGKDKAVAELLLRNIKESILLQMLSFEFDLSSEVTSIIIYLLGLVRCFYNHLFSISIFVFFLSSMCFALFSFLVERWTAPTLWG